MTVAVGSREASAAASASSRNARLLMSEIAEKRSWTAFAATGLPAAVHPPAFCSKTILVGPKTPERLATRARSNRTSRGSRKATASLETSSVMELGTVKTWDSRRA